MRLAAGLRIGTPVHWDRLPVGIEWLRTEASGAELTSALLVGPVGPRDLPGEIGLSGRGCV